MNPFIPSSRPASGYRHARRTFALTIISTVAWISLFSAAPEAATPPMEINNLAGIGRPVWSGDGGPAVEAGLNNPYGLTRGPDAALYLCDMGNHLIRRISPDGTISTVAGTGRHGYSGDGGPAIKADLNEPYEVRFDREGNLFFVEMKNNLIRRVDAKTRTISTVAGNGEAGFSGDGGPARGARFRQPHSIQFGPNGDLFVCDIGNHRIRRIDHATGMIYTFSGNGRQAPTPDGAPIQGTPLNGPRALDFDADGNLWLALREGNAVYKFNLAAGTIHHQAGTGQKGFTGNGGPAREAALSGPKGISVAPNGNVYLADTESHSIRMIDVHTGTLTLVAGDGTRGDGPEGPSRDCRLARPHGVFVDADGTVLVGDSETHRVRIIRRKTN